MIEEAMTCPVATVQAHMSDITSWTIYFAKLY